MDRDEALELLRGGQVGVAEWNRRRAIDEEIVSIHDAELRGALAIPNLRSANLQAADLRGANLRSTDLRTTNLRNADLRSANLRGADLRHTKLEGADLCNADLFGAVLTRANLKGAILGWTMFACDLADVIGLDETVPIGSSDISVSSILSINSDLPEEFLRGCGVRDEEIAYFRSVVGKPIRFYSCFISYCSVDEDFASRLHNDFQAAGIRCWKWNHDARTGRSLWGEIDQAIRVHDKLVLIASEASLMSPAVNREIERAILQEDERQKQKQTGKLDGNTDVLFPVMVDDFILKGWEHERKVDVTKKVIADARHWTDPKVYKAVLDKLIRDLKPAL